MHLRKTTTSPMRGLDVLYPFYQSLDLHHPVGELNVLQVGAGVATKFMATAAGKSKVIRRLESLTRSIPFPEHYFESYEPKELYESLEQLGYSVRLTVSDINPNVLSVVRNSMKNKNVALELLDISIPPNAFIRQRYHVCLALNVLYHIRCPIAQPRAARNLIDLLHNQGYLVGIPARIIDEHLESDDYKLEQLDDLLFVKLSKNESEALSIV